VRKKIDARPRRRAVSAAPRGSSATLQCNKDVLACHGGARAPKPPAACFNLRSSCGAHVLSGSLRRPGCLSSRRVRDRVTPVRRAPQLAVARALARAAPRHALPARCACRGRAFAQPGQLAATRAASICRPMAPTVERAARPVPTPKFAVQASVLAPPGKRCATANASIRRQTPPTAVPAGRAAAWEKAAAWAAACLAQPPRRTTAPGSRT